MVNRATDILKLDKLTIQTENGQSWVIEAIPMGIVITLPTGYRFRLDGVAVSDDWTQIELRVQPK